MPLLHLMAMATFFLEPYLGGVVAASRRLDPPKAYDQVKQVTFFL